MAEVTNVVSGLGQAPEAVPAPWTLVVDVGATGLKAAVLGAAGEVVAERIRVRTSYPCPPDVLVADVAGLAARLGPFHRASVGFPGMVRDGRVLSASNLTTAAGPGTSVCDELVDAWSGYDLAEGLARRLGVPVRVANDADVQGAAVVAGDRLELVVTLGTGFGTAAFYHGLLLPHYEFAHHPFRKGQTYEEQLGDVARRAVGDERWTRRVHKALAALRTLTWFDVCYIGGGNAKRLPDDLGPDVVLVDNMAGLFGGLKLWEDRPLHR